jgi:Replication-relaxation
MRLTDRCREMMKLLSVARWLTTSQIRWRFFGRATLDATRKRLRKLTEAGYVIKIQPNQMQEALFTLGPEGKRLLEREKMTSITLQRLPPAQLEHFLGVNDIRISAELQLPISYFFAYWELAGFNWTHPIRPDAVFGATNRSFAVEFDRGWENVRFFVDTKLPFYLQGLKGLELSRVLVVTDRRPRMELLAKAITTDKVPMLFTTIDLVREQGLAAPIFSEAADGRRIKLL